MQVYFNTICAMNTHAVILICLVIIEFDCMYVFLRKNQHYMAKYVIYAFLSIRVWQLLQDFTADDIRSIACATVQWQ